MSELRTAVDRHGEYILATNPQYTEMDRVYLTNRILGMVGDAAADVPGKDDALANLDALIDAAVVNGVIDDAQSARAILGSRLMDLATPTPSGVNSTFNDKYQDSPQAATDWFYSLSRANNYIQTRAIAQNVAFRTPTEFGDLEITINLSKPEKDPRDIAAAARQQQSGYPACQLCLENEGYAGRADFPARSNHRIVRFELGGQTWGLQYSPYAYFSEHAIFLDAVHEPMHIYARTFTNLLDIVTWLPHYFAGSNADLPIVGGSMLAHEHYQGGRHTMPMAVAKVERVIDLPDYADVQAGILNWPMSVIRLTSANRSSIAAAAEHIRAVWAEYSDPAVDILAVTDDGTKHHTVTPIARRMGDDYQLDIVLRDNQTSAKYPDGIFHPHQDVQHIKRENIGLIEVMGLAILPARLLSEMDEVRKYLLGEPNHMSVMHQEWADQLREQYTWTADNAETQLQQAIGHVFARVLADAGVFKRTTSGRRAFGRFVDQL